MDATLRSRSELPKRAAPISTAVGPSWHSGPGPALENAIGRLQTWIRKPVVRRMPDAMANVGGHGVVGAPMSGAFSDRRRPR